MSNVIYRKEKEVIICCEPHVKNQTSCITLQYQKI